MTNSSSTYLGIFAGVAIGGLISWWIYNRQKKTTILQDDILVRIEKIEENNGKILSHLEAFANHHDMVLNKIVHMNEAILDLNRRIDSFGEEK